MNYDIFVWTVKFILGCGTHGPVYLFKGEKADRLWIQGHTNGLYTPTLN